VFTAPALVRPHVFGSAIYARPSDGAAVISARCAWFLVIGKTIGVLTGAVQFLVLIRWHFLVPSLADMYS
jgi:hypothetical protein